MMLNFILNLIYPNVCGFCNTINNNHLCKKCELKLEKYKNTNIIDCSEINNKKFDYQINIFRYESIIREKLIQYKFNEKAYLFKTFSKIILNDKKICGFFEKYDIIIPVQIHKKRNLQRGYNQTELIAREIAKNTNLILENKVLIKQKNIKPQSGLTKFQRENNIKNAFTAKNVNSIKNKNIILLDDIYTTGSTVNECCKVLKKLKVNKIAVLTIAKD